MSAPGKVGAEAVAQKGKKRACVNHCKRWWWVHLIVFIAIVLLVVLLVIFVGVPNIAQDKINDAKLEVHGIRLTNTHTDKAHIEINSTIWADDSVSASLDAFDGEMYLEDLEGHTPFLTVRFPQIDVASELNIHLSQDVDIPVDAFTDFNTWLLNNETLRVTINGDTNIHVEGIAKSFGVNFKKTVELKGLNKFSGLTVDDPKVDPMAQDDTNFWANATIPNPSIVEFEVGNATFSNSLFGDNIGDLHIDNFFVASGDNVVPVYAKIEQDPVISAITRQPYCKDGVIPFSLIGKKVVNDGDKLAYFADALAQLNSTAEVDVGEALEKTSFKSILGCPDKDSGK